MPTLEDIAENSKIVIDTCFFSGHITKKTSTLEIEKFIAFLDNCGEKIIVVPGVIKENEKNPRNSKKGLQLLKEYINRGANQYTKDKHNRVASQIKFLKRVKKRLGKREVDFGSVPSYQSVFRMACYLSDSFKIKIPENRADESVVATAFFLAQCGSEKIAILSNDGDITNLCCTFIREGYLIRNSTKNRQIRIYGNYGKESIDNCTIRWDSTRYHPGRPKLSYQQQRTLRDLILAPIFF